MNPAVTLASAFVRRLDWIKVPVYCIAQFFGAFIASAVVYGVYYGKSDTSMRSGIIFDRVSADFAFALVSDVLRMVVGFKTSDTTDILNLFPGLFPGCFIY